MPVEMPEPTEDQISHERSSSRRARLAAWATVGVVGAAAAVGGIYAATSGAAAGGPSASAVAAAALPAAATSPAPSSSAAPNAGPNGGPGRPGRHGWRGHLGPVIPRVLHGEATVQTKDGGTKVVDAQRGTVTAIGDGTITVRSSDDVSFTYVTNDSTKVVDFELDKPGQATLDDVKVGDAVGVLATRSGDTRTATHVVDGQPKPGSFPPGHGPGGQSGQSGQSGQGGQGGPAAPDSSAAAA